MYNRFIPFPSVQRSRLIDRCIEPTSTHWFWVSETRKRLSLWMFMANHTKNKTPNQSSLTPEPRENSEQVTYSPMTPFPLRQRKTLDTNDLLTIVPSCARSESFPRIGSFEHLKLVFLLFVFVLQVKWSVNSVINSISKYSKTFCWADIQQLGKESKHK